MQYQAFDYLVCLNHRISPEKQLCELSWIILSTRMFTLSDLVVSHLVPLVPPFQINSFQHIIMCLYQTITNIEKDLRSVTFVTLQRDLMESILPSQAQARNMILPSIFNNFIPLADDFKPNLSVAEFADDLGEKVDMFQHDTILLSRCCLNLLKRNHIFDKIVFVDRLNRRGFGLEGEKGGDRLIGEAQRRDRDYKFYKLRGLPFKVVNQDIVNFLEIPELSEEDIEYQFRDNRFSGTVWVRVDAKYADSVEAKNQKHLSNRYIEVSKASKLDFIKSRNENGEMRQVLHDRRDPRGMRRRRSRSRSRSEKRRRRHSSSSENSCMYSIEELNDMGIMKMRGLPFEVTDQEILEFFAKHAPIAQSLRMGYNSEGRKSGEAAILFSTRKEAKQALEMDRQKIGSRYIELITIRSDQYKRFC